MQIAMVPREELAKVWNVCGPMLDPAVMRTKGRYHLVDLLEAEMSGMSSLWIAFNQDKEIVGCVHFTISLYPTGMKAGRLDYLGGRDRESWFNPMWETLCSYAKANQCSKLEMAARPGLVPYVVDRYGGRKVNVNVEVDL